MELQNTLFETLIANVKYLCRLINRESPLSLETLKLPVNELFQLKSDKYNRTPLQILEHAFTPLLLHLQKYAEEQFQFVLDSVGSYSELSTNLTACMTYITQVITSHQVGLQNFNEIIRFNNIIGHVLLHIGQFELIIGICRETTD